MQGEVSTNIRIPEDKWKAIKVKAAQEGRSMKDLILEGIAVVLGREEPIDQEGPSGKDLLLEFSGRVALNIPDGSSQHDRYLSRPGKSPRS